MSVRKNQGSITVESAILIPIILYVLLFVLSLLFYFLEMALIQAVTAQTVVMYKDELRTQEERDCSVLLEALSQELNHTLLFSDESQVSASANKNQLHIFVEVQERIPFHEVIGLIGSDSISIEHQVIISLKNSVEIARKRRLIEEEINWKES